MPPINQSRSVIKNRSALTFHLMMIASMITWGGSWVSAKVVAQQLSPEMLGFWRFALSTLSFIPFLWLLPKPVRVTRQGIAYSISGAILMSLYMYFFFLGLEHWFAGHAGVLVTSLIPLMTLLVSSALFRKRTTKTEIFGLTLGITGAAILLKLWQFDLDMFLQTDNILLILCPFLWALLTICSQRAAESSSVYIFSFITFGLSTLFFLPSALHQGIWLVAGKDANFWFNLFFLSVISGTIATTIFFMAAEKLGSYHASAYVFLVPLSALILSWIFLGEVPEFSTIIGGSIAIVAVYVINHRTG